MKYDINKHDIKFFALLHEDGNLIINHDYQRRGVWLHKDKIKLVESILLDLPIPELYLWKKETDPKTGNTPYEIVDGQQRITSVIDFITKSDEVLDERYLDDPKSSFSGKKFEELSAEDRQRIWKYQFVVRVIDSEENQDTITQMFLRLNRTNLSLNPQELRNAEFNGEFIDLSLEMSQLDFWKEYSVFNSSDIRRMLDVQFCSSILAFFRNGIQSETQTLMNKMYDRFNDKYEQKDEDRQTFVSLVDIIKQFFAANSLFAQKKSHLFTMFNLAFWFYTQKRDVTEDHLRRYREFCNAYSMSDEELESLTNQELVKDILLYKSYSVEGTGKKLHREQRLNILKKYIVE